MKPEGVLATIAEKARERGLPFLVAGGHAVIFHGAPRATFDLDLAIRRDDEERWLALLKEVGYEVHHKNPAFTQLVPLDESWLPVDLMLIREDTFRKLLADAVVGREGVEGLDAGVVSMEHLLAMKCHAISYGHRGRVVKDVEDILTLARNGKLDFHQPAIKAIVLKHGSQEIYDTLVRASKE